MRCRLLLVTIALSSVFGCATEPTALSPDAAASQPRPPVYYRTGSHLPVRDASIVGRDLVDDVGRQQAERDLYQRSSNPCKPSRTIPNAQPGGC